MFEQNEFTCDWCGESREVDNFKDGLEELKKEGWRAVLVAGEWHHYCPECNERMKARKENVK